MDYKIWIALYLIFATSIIYWDMNRHPKLETMSLFSDCHNAEIRMMNDKPLCTECKQYCKITKGNNK